MQALTYRGSDFEIHTARRSLRLNGSDVDCEPRVFDLIVHLIEQRERAVDKQELITKLWNGRPVSDASLSQLVYKARKALADDGESRACIQTVHGRGFRWIAAVTASAPGEPLPAAAAVSMPSVSSSESATPSEAAGSALQSTSPGTERVSAAIAGDAALQDSAATPPARAKPAHRRPLLWACLVLALVALAGLLWRTTSQSGSATAQPRVLVLPVEIAAGLEDLDWARLGMMGLIANALETEAGLATIEPAIARRLNTAEPPSPAQRRAWRETTGARHSLSLRLSRAGPLLQL
ncbi:winged helix-turn-helix domain-containing protein, partial [Tahibacter caeni]|uniref:winged helix-turn-helix domain-containing protein n=1 Tax=Tahibacter caeni TaxID=1453545 RepID=UPI002147524A